MKYYLAGPMSGIDKSNFPAFDAAATHLRSMGYEIVSPAELDDPDVRTQVLANLPTGKTWGDFLSRDVKVVADDCDGVIFLEGWHKSRGARLEAFVALLSGKKHFAYYSGDELAPLSRFRLETLRSILKDTLE